MKKLVLPILFLSLTAGAFAQGRPGGGRAGAPAAAPAGNDSSTVRRAAPRAAPKPYASVITDKALTHDGLFKTHKVDDRYFFEIPDSLLGRDILVIARISKAGAISRAAGGYAGDEI